MKINRHTAPFLIVLAAIIWGFSGLIIRTMEDYGLNTQEIAFLRVFCAMIFMGIFLIIFQPKFLQIKLKDIWCFIGTGIVSMMFFNLCYFYTIQTSSLSFAVALLNTSPIFIFLFSIFLFKERLTLVRALAIITVVLGCLFVTGIFENSVEFDLPAVIVGLCAGLGYGLYSIFSRFALNRNYQSLTICFYTFVFASAGLLFTIDFPKTINKIIIHPSLLIWIFLLSFVSAVVSYVLYTYGMSSIDNSQAAIFACAEPITATLVGVFYYHETLTFLEGLGIFLILFAAVAVGLYEERLNRGEKT